MDEGDVSSSWSLAGLLEEHGDLPGAEAALQHMIDFGDEGEVRLAAGALRDLRSRSQGPRHG